MFELIVVLVLTGLILYGINKYLPIDAWIKQVINIVVIICLAFYLLNAFGVLNAVRSVPVPQVRSLR